MMWIQQYRNRRNTWEGWHVVVSYNSAESVGELYR